MLVRSAALGFAALIAAGSAQAGAPTYSKDIAPILFKNCAHCHRPGEGAPMSLLSYKETRPWSKAIRQAVATKKMPPWLADPNHGKFANDRRLAQNDVDAILKWVDNGSPEGNPADMPPAPKFVTGWQLGEPDLVIKMPVAFEVPAEGVIPYKYFTAPTNFSEDKYLRAVEIRAQNPAVVHHIIMSIREPGAGPDRGAASDAAETRSGRRVQLAGTAPGLQPTTFPAGVTKLLKAGSELVFQMHYTTNGKAATDQSYVGLYFADGPGKVISQTAGAMNVALRIPAGDPNHEVRSSWTAKEDVLLYSMMPHMHVRGKDFKYTAVYPDGRSEVLLNVPRYDFNWQLGYQLENPILLPKGTRLECVAHYDNSPNNKYNPDPTKEVRWGDQTWEEMMIGWFSYFVPPKEAPLTSGSN